MTKQEYLEKVESCGLPLALFGVEVGKISDASDTIGIYQDGDQWSIYSVSDRKRDVLVTYTGDEDSAFSLLWSLTQGIATRMAAKNYAISSEAICVSKEEVVSYISEQYNMDSESAAEQWDYLRQNYRILCEFKHYIQTGGEFLEDEHASKWEGYTARKLYETTPLTPLGAFNYMIYLRRKPKEALKNLKDGLPIY